MWKLCGDHTPYVFFSLFLLPFFLLFSYMQTSSISFMKINVYLELLFYLYFFSFLGLINGPILKKYGFRKVSVISSIILFFGLVLTSRANSFAYFMVSYSIIAGNNFVLFSYIIIIKLTIVLIINQLFFLNNYLYILWKIFIKVTVLDGTYLKYYF